MFFICRSSVEEAKEMESKLSTLTKEKAKAEHKLTQLNVKVAKLTSDLKDEMTMNENLRKNQVRILA